MDEILFRSSQKLEDVQFHITQAVSYGKNVFHSATIQTKNIILSLLEKPYTVQLTDTLKEIWLIIIQHTKDFKTTIIRHINLSKVYDNLHKLILKKWMNKELGFCFAGFVVGGYIGYLIGKSVANKSRTVYYMQAVQCLNYSGVESVTVAEDAITKHECDKNEVMITVKAASIHEIDVLISNGYGKTLRSMLTKYTSYIKNHLPFTLGRDCTGIVTDIGQNVKRLEVGDEVWVSVPFWHPGTLSQMFIASECRVSLKPKKIGFESACSLPYAGTLALEVLEQVKLSAENAVNKRVFINGGCTPVGCILIQILKMWHAHITTTCFKRALPVAKALGANDVIVLPDLDLENVNTLQKEMELRDKFDVVISTKYSDVNFKEFCTTQFVTYTYPKPLKSDDFGIIFKSFYSIYVNLKCVFYKMFGYEIGNFGEIHSCYQTLDVLKKFVDNNELQTVVDKVFHPHEIEKALLHIQSSGSIGSTIITFR